MCLIDTIYRYKIPIEAFFHGRKEVIKILENKDYELLNGDCLELMKNI